MSDLRKIERSGLSPKNAVVNLVDWMGRNKCTKMIFDGDDTLWPMKDIIDRKIENCATFIAEGMDGDRDGWLKKIKLSNDSLFSTYKVSPRRWDAIIDEVIGVRNKKINRGAKEIFNQIYETPVVFFEGTEEFLRLLHEQKIPMAVLTHANENWTQMKYEWLGMERFIPRKNILTVSQDVYKTEESWRNGLERVKFDPDELLGAGDSPMADINPLCALKVRHCVWVNNGDVWSVHKQEMPSNVWRAKTVADILYLGEDINR